MIDFSEAAIEKIIYHRISLENSRSHVGKKALELGEEEETIMKNIFLKPFTNSATTYEFGHAVETNLNTLFTLSKAIYEDENFVSKSKGIYQHLKSVSKHPNIKDGDMFILKYDRIKLKNDFYKALGIYKVENKDAFIETGLQEDGDTGIAFKRGIGKGKLDKACLVLFTEEPYTVFVIDNNSTETDYWMNEFVSAQPKNDNVNSTNTFLSVTRSFVTEQYASEYDVSKADQIDLLNRSVDYFKTHDVFNKNEFEAEVLQDKGLIKSFRRYDEEYRGNNELDISDSFEISPEAVKKQARVFKSVLKLDKNFHVYIHGNRDLIEHGIDSDGRKFYKLYYEEEQ
jgi:hypothetical protein